MRDWTGRMPNGNVTSDEQEYVNAWGVYRDAVPELFPGFRVIAYDPDVLIGGDNLYRASVSLPLFVLDLLIEQRTALAAKQGQTA